MLRRGGVASLGCRVVGANGLWLQWWAALSRCERRSCSDKVRLARSNQLDECLLQIAVRSPRSERWRRAAMTVMDSAKPELVSPSRTDLSFQSRTAGEGDREISPKSDACVKTGFTGKLACG